MCFSCSQCGVPICESKCEDSVTHRFECKILAKRKNDGVNDDDDDDFDVIPAFRFLLWKLKDAKVFEDELLKLCSNIEEKVNKANQIKQFGMHFRNTKAH